MDGTEVLADVREEAATELDRLGSEKALIAATGADLETASVLRAAAATEALARDTFRAWAEDETDDAAREAFEEVVATETDHRERIVAALESDADPPGTGDGAPDPDALHEHLRELDDVVERVGAGLVGRSLAASRSLLQFVNFFVNEGDTRGADLFRELRADTDEAAERGAAVLDAVCVSDDDYDRARQAAVEAVRVAYREYADRLKGMGLDPKPVC